MEKFSESTQLTFREGVSGALGSISLACWIFLFVPQLIENYKYGSAEAISLAFVLVWFVGDVANFVGALRARLVPLVIATAVYFCFADTLLITQYLYYKAKNAHRARKHAASVSGESDVPDPTTPLLSRRMSENMGHYGHRRRSSLSARRRGSHADDSLAKILEETDSGSSWIKNTAGVIGVCLIGTAGWAIAWRAGLWKPTPTTGSRPPGDVAAGAQFFGYLSAVAYLGARIPQIIKNYREKSCEGLSLLFFILSLMGNLTYGAGILFHSTQKDYFLTNLPWLIGSLGTMVEDVTIFAQFRLYAPSEMSTSAVE